MDSTDLKKEAVMAIEAMPAYLMPMVITYIQALQKGIEEETRRIKAELIFQHMQSLPEEDYELSAEEKEAIEKGCRAMDAGHFVTWEAAEKELEV